MTTWQEFDDAAPELAGAVEERLRAHTHHVMATLRADGSPRLCGTEIRLLGGRLLVAGMPGARRFADLRRDPRYALHTSSDDADEWSGDARVSGTVTELSTEADMAWFRSVAGPIPEGGFELFALDICEAVHVGLDEARSTLVIRSWTPGGGVRESRRA
ncbi:MAG: pyridoxamine 5'-phosphate oxidase family protein [Kineosporiaceae bacterium]